MQASPIGALREAIKTLQAIPLDVIEPWQRAKLTSLMMSLQAQEAAGRGGFPFAARDQAALSRG